MSRRVKAFSLSNSSFPISVDDTFKRLPVGAKIVDMFRDYSADCYKIHVQHESFDEVPEGDYLPVGEFESLPQPEVAANPKPPSDDEIIKQLTDYARMGERIMRTPDASCICDMEYTGLREHKSTCPRRTK